MLELDATQRRAIKSEAKTIIVTGGPGSGKTHLLAERFAHLLTYRNVPLSSILILTFSSSSAARIRRKIEERIQQSYDELWIHTYHSFANRILKENGPLADGRRLFALVSPFREYLLVKELLRTEHHSFQSNLKFVALKDGAARELSDFFGLLKQNLISPSLLHEITRGLTPQLSDLSRVYSAYEKRLGEKNQIGIRDVVSCALDILEHSPKLLGEYHNRFAHLLVDECQEIDPAQLRLLKLLASDRATLFMVGDENQRIFRFRGSATGQASDIADARKEVEAIKLTSNYRLAPELHKASRNLIERNSGREFESIQVELGKELSVAKYQDSIEQAYAIAREIKGRVLDGASLTPPIQYSDFAVIGRSTYRSALPFQEAFSYYGIPYIVYNSTSFYQHSMVRLTADLVRLLINPDDETLLRVLSIPAFALDAVKLRKLSNSNKLSGAVSLYDAICRMLRDGSSTALDVPDEKTVGALKEFVSYFESIRQEAESIESPSALVRSIMQKLFYGEILRGRDTAMGIRDAKNLRSLYDALADIEYVFSEVRDRCTLSDVAQYMEHAFAHFSSQQENDPADEAGEGVRIVTVHQAKGMEFPFVFLVDMTDEYFPTFRGGTCLLDGKSLDKLGSALRKNAKHRQLSARNSDFIMTLHEQLKEERQLAYVAVTRASRKLTICVTEQSHFSEPVKPSPFIEEIIGQDPEAILERQQTPSSSNDVHSLLESSLNTQEIESALRTYVRAMEVGSEKADDLFRFFKSLGLDANFIRSELPFEPEPRQAPFLVGHRYSATQLSTYLVCPRQFFLERILRIAPERPEDFGLGQLIHRVLEAFHKEVKDFSGNTRALEAKLMKVFDTIWKGTGSEGSQIDAFCNQFPTLLQRAAIARRADEILRRYLKTEAAQAAGRKIIACEEFIAFAVREYAFSAKLDRIDVSAAGNHIIDYKTSGTGPKGVMTIKKKFLNVEQKPDYTPEDFQLPLYLLAGRHAGYNPVELSYYWVSQEDSSGMFKKSSLCVCDNMEDCLTPVEMQATEDGIVEVVKRIEAGDFAATPKSSYACSRCSFDFICSFQEEDVTENG